ncbi:MAG: substrate-binding domain-containing protein, partial [Halobacteria archaeon]|nr:substrate-binding domain-containing protein [Halobacteria archaeon]
VPVYTKPKVGIVSTGDELVRPGSDLKPGQIYDVNSFSTGAAVEDAGGEPMIYEHAGDDYDEMENTLRRATEECDVVLSSGSTSASAVDVVYRVIEEKGELLLHGIAVKPGKPTIFGRLEGTSYIGLPGNPISALTVFNLFASRVIRDAAGLPETPSSEVVEAKIASHIPSETGRTRLLPVGLVESPERGLLTYSLDKGSGATTSLSEADGYVVVDQDVNYLEEDEEVNVNLLGKDVKPPAVFGAGGGCPAVNRLLEDTHSRWLNVGSVEGARKLREGITDVAGVNLSVEYLSDLGIENARLVRGYERHVGLIVEKGNPEGYESLEGALKTEGSFGARPRGSGTRVLLESLLEERGLSLEEFDTLTFRSQDGVANAVESGKIKTGLGIKYVARKHGLGFVPLLWENYDFLVAEDRASKDGVKSLIEDLDEFDLKDLEGYKRSEETGDVVKKW